MATEIAKKQIWEARKENLKSANAKQINLSLTSVSIDEDTRDSLYYVLSDQANNGFVIVAADKRVWPIIGYSSDGKFSENNQPPAFVNWMEQRKREIAYAKSNNLIPDNIVSQKWENLSSSNSIYSLETTSVEPLLKTTWNQGCYYNSSCPADVNGVCGHVVTGCVATSMAQIMKYWNYPATGIGSHSYQHSIYGTLSADFGSTTYQWSQMPDNVTSENSAVATLMYHCGVAVDMGYNVNGSSAGYGGTTLPTYFRYSSNSVYVPKSSYSDLGWINLLKFELDSHRPVWYRGDDAGREGHVFVCDGYRNSTDFHFNWGWGGSFDGYFFIGNLNPGGRSYNDDQGAVIKIFPLSSPDAVGSILGSSNVCQGQTSVNYSVVAVSNAASYIWTLPNGAIGSSTTNSINVDFGNNAMSGIIKVKGRNASGDGPESSLAITLNPGVEAAGIMTGNGIVCPCVAEQYSIAPVSGATSYTWELPAGWSGSSSSAAITVIPGNSSGTISVKAKNSSCSGQPSLLYVTNGEPESPTNAAASSTTIFAGQSTTLQVIGGNLNSASDWVWYTGSCGGTRVGAGRELTVFPTNTTTYYVQATGCGVSTICRSVTVNVCSTVDPALPISIVTGYNPTCIGQMVTYSIPEIANATTYLWTFPDGASGIGHINRVTVSYGSASVSGNITVRGVNSCGDMGAVSTLAVTINAVPPNAGTISGTTTICLGQNPVTYTVPVIPNATSYIWTLPTGATGTSTTNSITVNYGISSVSGNITVKGQNNCGTGGVSTLAVTVNPKPATPIATVNANILHSNATSGNQWYMNNVLIAGAVNQDYTFTAIGDYSVIVTLNGCASDPSAVNVITGIAPTEFDQSIKVYPNPVTDELFLEYTGNTEKVDFEIINSLGQAVVKGSLFRKVAIPTTNFSPGLYTVKFKMGKTFEFLKIVKL